MKSLFNYILLALLLLFLILVTNAKSHNRPGLHNVKHAICIYFKKDCLDAIRVAKCESRLRPWAENGQYKGIFQMGANERRIFGSGIDPWSQARAAFAYYKAVGYNWKPWGCKP